MGVDWSAVVRRKSMARQQFDYNKMRSKVASYYQFKFRRRKNSNYTPAQKGLIVRTYRRLIESINSYERPEQDSKRYSFIRTKKRMPRGFDGIKTNKGIFYKYPGAKIVRIKKKGRWVRVIRTQFKMRREIFFPFPQKIVHDIEQIIDYVRELTAIYKPDYILWSINGFRGGTPYVPETFFLYSTEDKDPDGKIAEALAKVNGAFFNGVFFGWFPESKIKGFK